MIQEVLGIDVGATGIKGAIVDIQKGELASERIKYKTPHPATPKAVIQVIEKIVEDLDWKGKTIGVGFPAIIKDGVCHSASNVDDKFLGFNLLAALKKSLSNNVILLNDADAAGVAEMHYGIGKNAKENIIILLTLGTGIGSSIYINGQLFPNTELGHLHFKKSITEKYASNNAREKKDLSYKEWGGELDEVLRYIDFIFSPDLIILGGGISKKYDKYKEFLSLRNKIQPAQLLNFAGIVGAAYAAYQSFES